MTEYLILFGIVLGVNLMPAFGPPTWSIIVFYGFNTDMPVWAIVPVAAIGAALGRFLLACGFRFIGQRVSDRTKRNVAAARALFERNARNGLLALALFALSPVPSAQLFEAAGLARVRLASFTLAFFVGRVVSYSVYALTAKGIQKLPLGQVLTEHLTSPLGVLLQLFMIAALVGLTQIDWARRLGNKDG